MKLKRILFMALMALVVQAASAYDFMVGGIAYNINSDGKSVTVTSQNKYSSPRYSSLSGAINIPASVTYSGKTYSVTSIGDYAFYGCSGLTSVTLPYSVTYIGGGAFYGCSGLTSVTLPYSVTYIGGGAFSGTAWYNNQPDGLVYAGPVAYKYKGTMPSGTSIVLKEGTKGIADGAFYGCSGLTIVTIPGSVTYIGGSAFWGCTGLTSVTIPGSVTSIGNDAFSGTAWYNNQPDGLVYAGPVAYKYKGTMPSGTSVILKGGTKGIAGGAFWGCTGLTSVTIPNSVTSVGERAFYCCSGLTSVTIPNSVTSIGSSAFSSCTGLTSVTIGNSVTEIGYGTFMGCTGLTSVTIPNSVTSIGYYAFQDCSGLTSVTIGNSVTKIGEYAFYKCTGLTSVTIPSSVKYIGSEAFSSSNELTEIVWNAKSCNIAYNNSNSESSHPFYRCPIIKLIVGDEVQQIPSYLMYKQIFLTSVTIGNSVTSIGEGAFWGCTGLTSVTWNAKNCSDFSLSSHAPFKDLTYIKTFEFGSEVEKIPDHLCYGLTGLRSVTIGNSVTSIGFEAFCDCTGLTSVTIGNSVTKIGYYAFAYCRGLTSVTIGNSVTSIGISAFRGCSGLRSVTIPNSVTSISEAAFSGCSGLTSVTIPNSVTSIGEGAFYGCSGLTSVTIPNSVTSIVNEAFSYCRGLTSVTIPNSVTDIGSYAFDGCTGLTRIEAYPNPAKVSMGGYVFEYVPKGGTLHVLPKYLSAYQTASQWKDFHNIKADLTETDGIEEVSIDEIDRTLPMNVYNMNGVKMGDSLEGLPAGIYIVRQGSKSAKVVK